jgi:hypothetical protein
VCVLHVSGHWTLRSQSTVCRGVPTTGNIAFVFASQLYYFRNASLDFIYNLYQVHVISLALASESVDVDRE